jgi:hypothetical protein
MAEPRGHTLLTETLLLLNKVLKRHGDVSPYREILTRLKQKPGGVELGVAIREGKLHAPVDSYIIRIRDGKFEVVSRGEQLPVADWTGSVDFLRRVTGQQDFYLNHPEELDLGWLERRLAID